MSLSQCYAEKTKKYREAMHSVEAHHRMPDGKLIAMVQICLRCGKRVSFKRNRKRCPYCQGLLRTKAVILKNFK